MRFETLLKNTFLPFHEDMWYLASGAGTAFRSKKRLKDITEEGKPHYCSQNVELVVKD